MFIHDKDAFVLLLLSYGGGSNGENVCIKCMMNINFVCIGRDECIIIIIIVVNHQSRFSRKRPIINHKRTLEVRLPLPPLFAIGTDFFLIVQ